jgi:hypothetical protein
MNNIIKSQFVYVFSLQQWAQQEAWQQCLLGHRDIALA